MSTLPEPLTPPDCDCTNLDGFMLNVERLMASELVALSSHEVIGAALLLWCRAWKQTPAASLPDDDRINAAFAKLPLARFRKLKAEVMRGFVKCADGRLYHRTLAAEAAKAFVRKEAFRKKRETDATRLREWRRNGKGPSDETHDETPDETHSETRFVAEGQGQGQGQGQGIIDSPPASQAPRGASGDGRGTRLPKDWTLTPSLMAYAATCGYSEHETRFIAHRFENHWRAATGAKACKRDWDRTFQNWVTNENRRTVQEGAKAWRSNGAGPIDWASAVSIWREHGYWNPANGPAPDEDGYRGPALQQAH